MAEVVGARVSQVRNGEMTLTLPLPCPVSVHQEDGRTKIGLV